MYFFRDSLIKALIFALLTAPFSTLSANPNDVPEVPENASSIQASVPIDTNTGKIDTSGKSEAGSSLIAIQVERPEQVESAVQSVRASLAEGQRRASVPAGGVDEFNVITSQSEDDAALKVKISVARKFATKGFHLIKKSYQGFLDWKPKTFRVTVVGILAVVVGGSSYAQLTLSSNPLEAAVAHWIGLMSAGIIGGTEWQNLRIKNFVLYAKQSLMASLIDLVTFNEAQPVAQELIRNKVAVMFARNIEVNLWLFTVFKFVFLASLDVKAFGAAGLVTWPLALKMSDFWSIVGSSIFGTMVAFPTSQGIYQAHNEHLRLAGNDPAAINRANNNFQLFTSGAIAARGLCVVAILLGLHDLGQPGDHFLPIVAVASGTAGMVGMFGLGIARLRSLARAARERMALENCGIVVESLGAVEK